MQALQAYRQAFASVPSPFARDYYNAAMAALLLQEEKLAYSYLRELVEQKGLSLEYLARQPVLDSLQNTRKWRKFARKYPKRRQKFEQQMDRELRADLDELYARDQYFREAKGGWRVHGDTIKQIEAANAERLMRLIEQFGYPSENLIGVADTLEQLPRFSIVVVRQTKARYGRDFSLILKNAVKQGLLAPQPAAYLLDQQAGRNLYGSRVFVRVNCNSCPQGEQPAQLGKYLVAKTTEQQRERINARRQELGLEPLDEYKQKVRFSDGDRRFKLAYTWSVANYVVPSSEAAEVLLDGLTLQR